MFDIIYLQIYRCNCDRAAAALRYGSKLLSKITKIQESKVRVKE
ncbi:hypothetical protein [Merismopedia glauca]